MTARMDTSSDFATSRQRVGQVPFFENLAEVDRPSSGRSAETAAMKTAIVESMRTKARQDLRDVLQHLEKNHAGITEGVATALGAGTGAATSLTAMSSLGTVSGLSAAGVKTGLAAAGGLLGGGTLLGVGVLAAPVAALGMLGYGVARRRHTAKRAAAIGMSAKKICEIQTQLIQHKEHFKEELIQIRTILEILTRLKAIQ
ncbi:MAG TPA: hypothetical protein HPP97_15355 [Desulfuromonadales bacterium]|nr:hypothetical protein [Desulfuromonadales bacterium]